MPGKHSQSESPLFWAPGFPDRPLVEIDEGDGVPVIHRDDQPVTFRVVGHRDRARNAGGNDLGRLSLADAGNGALSNAADILGAIVEDDEAVVSGVDRVLGVHQFTIWGERVHSVRIDVHDDDVALRVKGDSVEASERRPLDQDRGFALRRNPVDAPAVALVGSGLGRLDRAVLGDLDVVEALGILDGDAASGLAGRHVEPADVATYSRPLMLSLPKGWFSVRPLQFTPIHFSVCAVPSGLTSDI